MGDPTQLRGQELCIDLLATGDKYLVRGAEVPNLGRSHSPITRGNVLHYDPMAPAAVRIRHRYRFPTG